MSQPELDFEFDPPDFLSDKARSPQVPKKLHILKHVTAAGLLVAATTGIVSLFYGYVNNDMVMGALAKKKDSSRYGGYKHSPCGGESSLGEFRRKNQ